VVFLSSSRQMMEFQVIAFHNIYNSSLPVIVQLDAVYSVQLKKHRKVVHLSESLQRSSLVCTV
jgi:hypothetical protein